MADYIVRHNEIVSQWSGYIRDIGEAIKNAFVGFVYNADGSVSSSFSTALSYIILASAICVIVTLFSMLFKFRR